MKNALPLGAHAEPDLAEQVATLAARVAELEAEKAAKANAERFASGDLPRGHYRHGGHEYDETGQRVRHPDEDARYADYLTEKARREALPDPSTDGLPAGQKRLPWGAIHDREGDRLIDGVPASERRAGAVSSHDVPNIPMPNAARKD
ncbi:MAG: hypothetical protein ACFCUT_03700 [Kiloniellaceae bacterium]